MSKFDKLKDKLKAYLSAQKVSQVEAAYQLAEVAHNKQFRNSGEPYITHPVAVASILADMHLDVSSIMAALLHDVIEDTEIDKETLAKQFGQEVAGLVDGVTKLTQINFETRVEAQAANFRKMMMAMVDDIRVILIKLSDRLHNMRTLGHMPAEKRQRIAKETLDIYAPIANRLGMRAFRDEFCELGFQMLHPVRFQVLKNAIKKARGNRKSIVAKIKSSLQKNLKSAGLRDYDLFGREKSLYSIYRKMEVKNLHLAEVMDVYAFRVVVDSDDQCYRALGAVHSSYKPVPERFKDYIAISKANGYQSLHTTLFGPYGVPIEIQIRTKAMHQMAENGIAAHWLYKAKDQVVNQAQIKAREWIRGVMEIQQSAGDSLEFIESVKIDLFPDEVYVFTPRGEIMELPSGSTAVDFAYAVHSDIGNSCVAVKIDRQLMPLSTKLASGNAVEIITAPGARPNPNWLNFVATGKARSNIRHYLKKQQRKESIDVGWRLLDVALEKLSVKLEKINKRKMKGVLKLLSYETADDLFEDLGLGNQMAVIIAQRIVSAKERDDDVTGVIENTELAIKGTEGMAVSFAHCCHPIPGDPSFGILNSGYGIAIHCDDCANVANYSRKNPEKCIPIRWEDDVIGEFEVGMTINIENRRGALATLALAIADAESNINDVNVQEYDGRYVDVNLLITVAGRIHLARVMRRVRQIHYVSKITRA